MYKYEVISYNLLISCYIIDLFKFHGLCYSWEPSYRKDFEDTICIKISSPDKKKDFELLFSTKLNSINCCQKLTIESNIQFDWYKLFYTGKEIFEFPLWSNCFFPVKIEENVTNNLKPFCYIKNKKNQFCIGVYNEDNNSITIFVDIVKYLEYSLLGIDILNTSEDWCDINGYLKTHKNATNTFVDDWLTFIRTILMTFCHNALPVYINYYPLNKSAPIIITGDSDESTFNEISNYFKILNRFKCKSCLLIKDIKLFNEMSLINRDYQFHSFGIHPFSQVRDIHEYSHNVKELYDLFIKSFGLNCSCTTRNHLFQNIDARKQINIERIIGIHFDLNSVLSNNNAWIGTGSGVGVPIPFPPIENCYSVYPLHFTTVIEDDVFLFNHQYCYKALVDDIYTTNEFITNFLNNWIIKKNKPAQVNLHPQNSKEILYLIINWKIKNKIWNPNLNEYNNWLLEKNSTVIQIENDKYKVITTSKRLKINKLAKQYERI